ncbi:acid phosphatase, partial [Mycolicibacterium smegmatis]
MSSWHAARTVVRATGLGCRRAQS